MIFKNIFGGLMFLFLAFGCQKQGAQTEDQPKARVPVDFTITLPKPQDVATRAGSSDTDVENLDLLVFDQDSKFLERIPVDDIVGTGSTKTFIARLDLTNNARTIQIIANARRGGVDRVSFGAVTVGMTETLALDNLNSALLTADNAQEITPLIMWGRTIVNKVESSMTISGVTLIRSQARIDVVTAAPTVTNGLNNFELISYTLASAPSSAKVAPALDSQTDFIPGQTNQTDAPRINYFKNPNLDVTGNGYWASLASSEVLYAYETGIHTGGNTAPVDVIIYGKYKGVPGYYKVNMKDNVSTDIDLIRNHRYILSIESVNGAGYATLSYALANYSENIQTSIVDQNDPIRFIQADGNHELGVSHNEVAFYGSPSGSPLTVELGTVYATRPQANLTVTASNLSPYLQNIRIQPAVSPNCYIVLGDWVSIPQAVSGTVTLTDGKLTQKIEVSLNPVASNNGSAFFVQKIAHAAQIPWETSYYLDMHNYPYTLSSSLIPGSQYPGAGDVNPAYAATVSSRTYKEVYLYIKKPSAHQPGDFLCYQCTYTNAGQPKAKLFYYTNLW